jgi:hypothetical protein
MALLKIERVGGIAGYGAPGSHVTSRGRIDSSELAADDQKAVEALFNAHDKAKKERSKSLVRDDFRYRISRTVDGDEEMIEVPEGEVPAALVRCVKDELI